MTGNSAKTNRARAEDEVVELCRDLIRIDSSNYGDGSGPGERAAAEYVAEKLSEVDLEVQVLESAKGRTSLITRITGTDPSRDALLIHGHLDVVPAREGDWRFPPFAGEIADGCLWGRGAIDMKNMDAMILAVIRDRMRTGRKPARDVVVTFLADEEAGGGLGARWLVEHHRELFADCTEAIGEVGGFSVEIRDDLRLYLIQTAEKGAAWMRLTAAGTAGHGSMINEDNAVTALCEAVARLGRHRFPVRMTPAVRAFLDEVSAVLGIALNPDNIDDVIAKLGPIARIIGATIRNTVQPTMLDAGYKSNVVPGQASAVVDGRFLPGYEEEFFTQLDEVLGPRVTREFLEHLPAVQTSFDGDLVAAMAAALSAEDPSARTVPYCVSGGTDAKSFASLGMRCFGFSPLRLPPDLDFAGMFHGVNERAPLGGLRFGARVLDRFLDLC